MKKKQVVLVPNGPPKPLYLSPAVRAGDFIFVSGNVGLLPGRPAYGEKGKDWMPGELISGGIAAETRQTLENVKALLEAAGATLDDVVKVNTLLRDIDRDFHAYNDVYMEYFKGDLPARTTVEAKIYNRTLVEIECVAYKPVA
ncbi:MAG: RidA family protein [Burkholderiales bacterium]|nr:RidA family protein [Burkholderiales bacterium]